MGAIFTEAPALPPLLSSSAANLQQTMPLNTKSGLIMLLSQLSQIVKLNSEPLWYLSSRLPRRVIHCFANEEAEGTTTKNCLIPVAPRTNKS